MNAQARPRGVFSNWKSTNTQRLHVVRDAWMFRPEGARAVPRVEPGRQTVCGQSAVGTLKSPVTVLDPLPAEPPEGLTWCPMCVGHLAECLGLTGVFGRMLAEATQPGSTSTT